MPQDVSALDARILELLKAKNVNKNECQGNKKKGNLNLDNSNEIGI